MSKRPRTQVTESADKRAVSGAIKSSKLEATSAAGLPQGPGAPASAEGYGEVSPKRASRVGGSTHGRKNTPPAPVLRPRRRLGFSESRVGIISASGFSVGQCRKGAAADRNACGVFFELALRPGRIAPEP